MIKGDRWSNKSTWTKSWRRLNIKKLRRKVLIRLRILRWISHWDQVNMTLHSTTLESKLHLTTGPLANLSEKQKTERKTIQVQATTTNKENPSAWKWFVESSNKKQLLRKGIKKLMTQEIESDSSCLAKIIRKIRHKKKKIIKWRRNSFRAEFNQVNIKIFTNRVILTKNRSKIIFSFSDRQIVKLKRITSLITRMSTLGQELIMLIKRVH